MSERIQTLLRSWIPLGVIAINALGVTISGFIGLIHLWQNRKKPWYETEKLHSESELNDSEAVLNMANARSIEFNDDIKAGQTLLKLIRQAGKLELRIIQLNEELRDRDEIIKNQKADIDAYEKQKETYILRKKLGLGE